ncbi:uncharacterized protein TRAVEDRAFT_24023 [Trametes versicolor FP-101664 SS1]|uniref:uncharacterized protein n=1 Tax=Trametes versicolor (strain FP-101664) TaxID=717944 RepID=UPI0004622F01|nr:uncharacterized protein TRAVEDRAFT_24023 [Trametes versicolor FP-101664 SS1]EIW52507.1 hypothetical protein TRAVEDRAFT_24023 [Trametes versicolor FP-101664 SS1]
MNRQSPGEQPKRRPGRPKGSKNKPSAKNVGRPRKDGQPPQKRVRTTQEEQRLANMLHVSEEADNATTSAAVTESLEDEDNEDNRTSSFLERRASSAPVRPTATVAVSTAAPAAATSSALVYASTETPADAAIPPLTQVAATTVVDLPEWYAKAQDNPYGSDIALAEPLYTIGGEFDDSDDRSYVAADEDDLDDEFRACGDDDAEDDFAPPTTEVQGKAGEGSNTGTTSTLPASRPTTSRSSMPIWLANEYALVRDKLKGEIAAGTTKSSIGGPSSLLPPTVAAGRRTTDGKVVFLQQLGWVDKPRRVVDIDHCEYIIGYRYRCGNRECRHTYRSWSPAILDVLPESLAMQFTFRLTYRSGLTDRLTGLLRDMFRVGIGAETFTSVVQSHHYRRYDQLHLQYLELVRERREGNMSKFLAKVAPFSSFSDRAGYAGFVPSSMYFRKFYDTLIESWAPQIQQHTAMLSAEILSAMKRLARVHGVSVFPGLHSTVNEYGEIRAMALSASKAHDQYIPILSKIPTSLRLFGHRPTQCIFTDNVRADKLQLEAAFPSLRDGVSPIPTLSDLPPLALPPGWTSAILSTVQQVNLRFNIIMNHRTSDSLATVAFDMEWPVDTSNGIHGRVALIQIAYQQSIYLIQTSSFIEDGKIRLPSSLLTFLRSPLYRKVGVNIGADFKKLFADCGFSLGDPVFAGHVELGALAVSRNAAMRRGVGLADLVRNVLRRSLNKDPNIRVSTRWADRELLPDFVAYAALDVYAVWAVYAILGTMETAQLVTTDSPGGSPVTLYASDGREVASGIIALDRVDQLNGIKVTPARTLITVSSVRVPGYMHPPSLSPSHSATALSAFGSPPFQLVVFSRMLRTAPASPDVVSAHARQASDLGPPSESNPLPVPPPTSTGPPPTVSNTSTLSRAAADLTNATSTSKAIPCAAQSEPPTPGATATNESVINTGLLDSLNLSDPLPLLCSCNSDADACDASSGDHAQKEQSVEESLTDPDAEAALRVLLAQYDELDSATLQATRSRVLGDIFHLHHQFPISQHHGLRRPFSRALSAALFIPDREDKAAVEAVLKQRGLSYNSKILSDPAWVLRRVRRYVPPPEILLPRVTAVIKTYGALKDSVTGQPLFNQRAWDISANILENVRMGYYSDPPGLQLFYQIGQDKYGLTLYRCCRGTNDVEGGVHQNLIRRFTSFNISPRHAVGTLNRTGRKYLGHFDIPLKNRTARILDTLAAAETFSSQVRHLRSGWVNGDDYTRADEVFGILRFDENTQQRLGMLPYSPDFVRDTRPRHAYLSERQGTRFAVLPVHSRDERDLFHLLVETATVTTAATQPNWEKLVNVWAGHADGRSIFYKLPEQLKSYYKTWLDFCNENNTVALNVQACKRIRTLLKPSTRTARPVSPVHPVSLDSAIVVSPARPSPEPDTDRWSIQQLLARHETVQFAVQYRYGDRPSVSPALALRLSRLPALPKGSDEHARAVTAISAPGGGR